MFPHALYGHPILYSVEPIINNQLRGYLSNGRPFDLCLTPIKSQQQGSVICSLMAQKLLSMLQMLPCTLFKACFNPFQSQEWQTMQTMPGWQLTSQSVLSPSTHFLCLNAVQLHIHASQLLSEDTSENLIDNDCGTFYQKENIVRVDKNNGKVYFRNGSLCRYSALCPVTLHHLNGYALAHHVNQLLSRIKSNCGQFVKCWQLVLDKRFVQVPANFPTAGTLSFR